MVYSLFRLSNLLPFLFLFPAGLITSYVTADEAELLAPILCSCAAISRDGTVLAVANLKDRIDIWSLEDGHFISQIEDDNSSLSKPLLALSADGDQLFVATSGGEGGFLVFNTSTGKVQNKLPGIELWYDTVGQKILPDMPEEERFDYMSSNGINNTFCISSRIRNVDPYPGFAVSPNGDKIWIPQGSDNKLSFSSYELRRYILVLDVKSGKHEVLAFTPPQIPTDRFSARGVAISGDSKRGVVVDGWYGFTIFDTDSLQPIRHSYEGDQSGVGPIAFSPKGDKAVVASSQISDDGRHTLSSGVHYLWTQTATSGEDHVTPDKSGITSLSFSMDGVYVLAGTTSGRALVLGESGNWIFNESNAPEDVAVTLVTLSHNSKDVVAVYITQANEKVILNRWNLYGEVHLKQTVVLRNAKDNLPQK